jgi:hypothetical protein
MSKHKALEENIVGFIYNKCKSNFMVKEATKITQYIYDDCKDKDIKRM